MPSILNPFQLAPITLITAIMPVTVTALITAGAIAAGWDKATKLGPAAATVMFGAFILGVAVLARIALLMLKILATGIVPAIALAADAAVVLPAAPVSIAQVMVALALIIALPIATLRAVVPVVITAILQAPGEGEPEMAVQELPISIITVRAPPAPIVQLLIVQVVALQ